MRSAGRRRTRAGNLADARRTSKVIASELGGNALALPLLDFLFEQPLVTISTVERKLKCVYVTASKLVEHFVRLGLLKEITGHRRNRRYRYEPYLALFEPSRAGESRNTGA
jgi:Fic family protein